MSRIGKKPILIPKDVKVEIKGQKITVNGPKGQLSLEVHPEIEIKAKDDKVFVAAKVKSKKTKAFWGLMRTLIFNMIEGVTKGYEKKLKIEGIGYRATRQENVLVLQLGFSHPIEIQKPENIEFLVEKNIITISGIDKNKVTQLAAKIRKIRPPDPYKGKGIRYLGEVVKKKPGKKAAAVTT